MREIHTIIGDHIIQINSSLTYENQTFLNNFHSYEESKTQQPDLIITIIDDYGVPFTTYDVEITKTENKIIYRRDDYLIETDPDYQFASIFVFDDFALKHALLNLYSAFLIRRNWGLLIHSSCVIEKGEAHIFAGQSGAGKSTAAKLSYPRPLLSDEATPVKITQEEVKVYNSPFRSEIGAERYLGSKDLTSIQILHQALQNKRDKIAKSDSFLQLIDKVFYWPHSHEEIKTINRLMTMLVKQVPVYDLHFQKNNTFWELIHSDKIHSSRNL